MVASALVTGATSGIGRALVVALRAKGHPVFATGRDGTRLAALCAETGCQGQTFDLAEESAPAQIYEAAVAAFGAAPDFLVNNAGFNSRKAAWVDVTAEEFDLQWRVNLRSPALLAQLALRDMKARGSGHIVQVLSTVVLHGSETMGAYTAVKHGLYGLTKVLIKEARPFGVKVTAVHPGGTDTQFRDKERPDYMRPESAAHMICGALLAPADVVVHELTFRPLVESNF
jgi:NAD(P)-dependent dehydrogenase (short-subunit alcohol dehydrogenase family)